MPRFLTRQEVLAIHRHWLEGELLRRRSASRLRRLATGAGCSRRRLVRVLAMPGLRFEGSFVLREPFEMAAAYLFHMVERRPFVEGNRETGLLAALRFLEENGRRLVLLRSDRERLLERVMNGGWREEEAGRLLQEAFEGGRCPTSRSC